MPKPVPTIRELAARLGVSHTTVSLALRNHASIPPATRKRVQETARKLGYRSNVLVSALLAQVRQGKLRDGGESVALLTVLPVEEWHRLPSVTVGMKQGRERAAQLGLRLEAFSIGDRGAFCAQVERILESRGYRGVIVPPLPSGMPPLQIAWDRFAVVALGYSFPHIAPHRVVNAHFNGIVTCYERLRAAGRSRIGLVLPRDDDDRARHYWLSGFLGASMIQGGARLKPLLMDTSWDPESMQRWFDRQRPDAIIGMSRSLLLDWLTERGVKVPEEVSYTCLDILNGSARPMAGIRQSWGEIFSASVELMAGQLSRNEIGMPRMPKVTLIDGQWCDGPTV